MHAHIDFINWFWSFCWCFKYAFCFSLNIYLPASIGMSTVTESFSPTESLSFTDLVQPETIFELLPTPIKVQNKINRAKANQRNRLNW